MGHWLRITNPLNLSSILNITLTIEEHCIKNTSYNSGHLPESLIFVELQVKRNPSSMKEIRFLQENHELWIKFEQMLDEKETGAYPPDTLADFFVRVTDDLSWARTYYPGSATEKYLNDLAARAYLLIYKNKREKRSRLITFWTEEIPLIMRNNLLNLFIAFLIFGLSAWIGVISAQHDESFVRLIMGDAYVDMTLNNMDAGDPLGVYKQSNQFTMFFTIALNNARVALFCILAGILGWIGVGFLMFTNGVLLGTFFYFLSSHGFYKEAMLTIWIHGMIEIFCIVVAGAGGIMLGHGLWFPGAWPRGRAFLRSTREALKIGLGLIPFFFLAAFFEGFLTRYTEMHDAIRLLIIIGSLIFMVGYFVIWPIIIGYQTKQFGRVMTSSTEDQHKGKMVALKIYLLSSNSRFLFLLAIGLILIGLPSLALVMHFVLDTRAELFAYFFFAICFGLGVLFIFLAVRSRQLREEDELVIQRNRSLKTAGYEQ
jgi:uncharacterized membrane protein SpoIIM required for sporulation